jgi:hypothetical protein
MAKAQKEASLMGRPTIPILAKLVDEPLVDAKKQMVTLRAELQTGPNHVRTTDNGTPRVVDVQIPLAKFGAITIPAGLPAAAGLSEAQKQVLLPKRPKGKQLAEPIAIKVFELVEGSREISVVHTAGCPAARRADQIPHEDTVSSRDEVREMIYPHADFEYDPNDGATVALYMEDITFHACVAKKLS